MLRKYLLSIGFSEDDIKDSSENLFIYQTKVNEKNIQEIPFFYFKENKELQDYRYELWNENKIDLLIAINNDTPHIIYAKEKPYTIDGFSYGLNTKGYEEVTRDFISKENIDNSLFFKFIAEKQKELKRELDKDLLNNLIALKSALSSFDKDSNNIDLLILKCIFVKYLEDRQILPNKPLTTALSTGNQSTLIACFDEIRKINGDILNAEIQISDQHIRELHIFFSEDYLLFKRTRQSSAFFPYQFDKIPIQLISNIYENFLSSTNRNKKKTQGIYYTRTFVVDFMLKESVYPILDTNKCATILDPACGSGAFLVQTFKYILLQNKNCSIDQKMQLLSKQIFGVDIDLRALQITAFSLALTLLEGIDIEEIQTQIAIRQPIIPSMIGINLIQKNTITDEIFFNIENTEYRFFDCIVANPPWGQIKEDKENPNPETIKELNALKWAKYKNVGFNQRSQCFLLKIKELCHEKTQIAVIVNNSNFLNEESDDFRKELLLNYNLRYYYDVSALSPILFEGTKEPASILILDSEMIRENHNIQYITPQLTAFSQAFKTIHFTQKDIKTVKQRELLQEDMIWRVFVNGNWKDYKLLKKIIANKDKNIFIPFCSRGINPNGAEPSGEPEYMKMLKAKNLRSYYIDGLENLSPFNIKQKSERMRAKGFEKLFKGERILLKRNPTKSDKLRLISAYTNEELIFTEDIITIKIEPNAYQGFATAIINSALVGYYFCLSSSQMNKGEGLEALKVNELKNIPFAYFSNQDKIKIQSLIQEIQNLTQEEKPIQPLIKEIDDIIFDGYGLLTFEKERIREFYQVNVERKNDEANPEDLRIYANKFRTMYQRVLKNDIRLNAYYKSSYLGMVVYFKIVPTCEYKEQILLGDIEDKKLLTYIKNKQLQNMVKTNMLNEDKVKIYEENEFFIIKSKYMRDWTLYQAIEDANEEIHELLNKLPHHEYA